MPLDESCAFNSKGKPITLESAATKFFMGVAFVVVAVALAFTGRGGGWWFWMLIPAFMFIGGGVAQYLQIRRYERSKARYESGISRPIAGSTMPAGLPPLQTDFIPAVESRYKTGDLVPPSVTETTTRHLDVNTEGETMTLPKRN